MSVWTKIVFKWLKCALIHFSCIYMYDPIHCQLPFAIHNNICWSMQFRRLREAETDGFSSFYAMDLISSKNIIKKKHKQHPFNISKMQRQMRIKTCTHHSPFTILKTIQQEFEYSNETENYTPKKNQNQRKNKDKK